MIQLVRLFCGGTPLATRLLGLSQAVLLVVIPVVASAADDAYLELLNEEVTKVEGVSTDTADDKAKPAPSGETNPTAEAVPSREVFEAQLRTRHVGTYSFYRRLPERSREQVFLDYRNGASMEALRSKIIDRYLNP